MIESIHIINRESGISLFIRKYTSIPVKDDIIFVGFLKAMEDLSQETKNESVQEIILNESKIVFYQNSKLIVVGITPKAEDTEFTRSILKTVGDKFIDQYKTQLKYFSGKISEFDDFSEFVDALIKNKYGLDAKEPKKSEISFDPLHSFMKYIKRPELVLYNIVDKTKDLRDRTVKSYRDIVEIFTNRRRYALKEKIDE
ncbi:MAG: hypothetical protein ACTSRG_08645 [Candidatus Helarchaeota archaeon]